MDKMLLKAGIHTPYKRKFRKPLRIFKAELFCLSQTVQLLIGKDRRENGLCRVILFFRKAASLCTAFLLIQREYAFKKRIVKDAFPDF